MQDLFQNTPNYKRHLLTWLPVGDLTKIVQSYAHQPILTLARILSQETVWNQQVPKWKAEISTLELRRLNRKRQKWSPRVDGQIAKLRRECKTTDDRLAATDVLKRMLILLDPTTTSRDPLWVHCRHVVDELRLIMPQIEAMGFHVLEGKLPPGCRMYRSHDCEKWHGIPVHFGHQDGLVLVPPPPDTVGVEAAPSAPAPAEDRKQGVKSKPSSSSSSQEKSEEPEPKRARVHAPGSKKLHDHDREAKYKDQDWMLISYVNHHSGSEDTTRLYLVPVPVFSDAQMEFMRAHPKLTCEDLYDHDKKKMNPMKQAIMKLVYQWDQEVDFNFHGHVPKYVWRYEDYEF